MGDRSSGVILDVLFHTGIALALLSYYPRDQSYGEGVYGFTTQGLANFSGVEKEFDEQP